LAPPATLARSASDLQLMTYDSFLLFVVSC